MRTRRKRKSRGLKADVLLLRGIERQKLSCKQSRSPCRVSDQRNRARGPLQGASNLTRPEVAPEGDSVLATGGRSGLGVPSPKTPALPPGGGELSPPFQGQGKRPSSLATSGPQTLPPPDLLPSTSFIFPQHLLVQAQNPTPSPLEPSSPSLGEGPGSERARGTSYRSGGREGRRVPRVPGADEPAAESSPRSRAASASTVTVEATPARELGAVLAPPHLSPARPPPPPGAGPRPAPGSARGRRWAPGLACSPGRTHTSTHARPEPLSPRPALVPLAHADGQSDGRWLTTPRGTEDAARRRRRRRERQKQRRRQGQRRQRRRWRRRRRRQREQERRRRRHPRDSSSYLSL